MNKIITLLLLLTLSFSGCTAISALGTAMENPVLHRTVQYATIKYLSGDEEKALEAERIVLEMLRITDQSLHLSISELEQLAIDIIPWEGLHEADQFILKGLLEDMAGLLRERVGDGDLNPEDRVRVQVFLTWVLQAIRVTL